jgi:hypothetical protein
MFCYNKCLVSNRSVTIFATLRDSAVFVTCFSVLVPGCVFVCYSLRRKRIFLQLYISALSGSPLNLPTGQIIYARPFYTFIFCLYICTAKVLLLCSFGGLLTAFATTFGKPTVVKEGYGGGTGM